MSLTKVANECLKETVATYNTKKLIIQFYIQMKQLHTSSGPFQIMMIWGKSFIFSNKIDEFLS